MSETLSIADEQYGYRFGCDGLMTIQDATQLLGISRWTLARRIEEGRIRRGHDGRRVVLCRRSINDFINQLED